MLAAVVSASILAGGPSLEAVLEAPWACSESFPCTQGNGGATSHTGVAEYAWDFGIPLGTDIKAARSGTVSMIKMSSFSGGCDPVYANDANYVVIDHGDATAALYLHVEGGSSDLQVGDPVAVGDTIARVGLTGWTCGAHLHFQVQELCGSWWCQSVPAQFFGAGAVAYGEQLPSENCGLCTATLSGGQTTISESEVPCFDRISKWWWDTGEGLDGHHWFTYATAAAQAETFGRWRFSVTTPGDYEVEVHIPSANASASGAVYAIHHAGVVDTAAIDQSNQKGWQLLGSFAFDGGGDEYLELADNTGEPEADLIPLAFDSVRFTYVSGGDGDGDGDPTGDGDGDGNPTGDGDGDGESTGDGDGEPAGDGDDEPAGDDGLEGDDAGTGDGGSETDEGPGFERGEEGCACASDPRRGDAGPLGLAFALFGVVFVTRRRRQL